MFGSSLVIGDDILDIGTHKFELRHDQRAIGSGAMIPRLALGEPGQFDVPNVADVSTTRVKHEMHLLDASTPRAPIDRDENKNPS